MHILLLSLSLLFVVPVFGMEEKVEDLMGSTFGQRHAQMPNFSKIPGASTAQPSLLKAENSDSEYSIRSVDTEDEETYSTDSDDTSSDSETWDSDEELKIISNHEGERSALFREREQIRRAYINLKLKGGSEEDWKQLAERLQFFSTTKKRMIALNSLEAKHKQIEKLLSSLTIK